MGMKLERRRGGEVYLGTEQSKHSKVLHRGISMLTTVPRLALDCFGLSGGYWGGMEV